MQGTRAIFRLLAILLLCASAARAETATVAVAANLLPTAYRLADAFGADTGHRIDLAHGSTGRLYAQIRAGAPFDVFLSADADRPALLDAEGRTTAHRTYALGRIVLVAAPGLLDGDLQQAARGRRLAIADPALAPYGLAATQALVALGVDTDRSTLITGDSIGQVAGFVATGNVDIAVISLSLLADVLERRTLDHRILSETLHDPIRQDGVLLTRGADNPAARAFWDWMQGDAATAILRSDGYGVPGR